jgi:SAM-dependent methyltransferase
VNHYPPPPQAYSVYSANDIREAFFNYRKDINPITKWGANSEGKSATGVPVGITAYEKRERAYADLLSFNKQSLAFYLEVLPLFYQYILDCNMPLDRAYSFLDVGSRTGAGANMYGEIFSTERWGYRIKLVVDTTDINEQWNKYQKLNFFVNRYLNKNIFDFEENSYDIVFCSHTIEHLDNPVEFVQQLKKVSSYFAFVTCPYEEKNPIVGHRTITKDIVQQCTPEMFMTYKSVNRWHPDLECCVFAM